MPLSHTLGRLSASIDEPNLVVSAGLVPAVRLADKGGLPELAKQHVTAMIAVADRVGRGSIGLEFPVRRLVIGVAVAGLSFGALSVSTATASPGTPELFDVPGGGALHGQMAEGPDGNMWMPLGAVSDFIRIAPDGSMTTFNASNIDSPFGMTAGPDGNMWITQVGGVARFSPASPTVGTVVPIPSLTDPRAIATGPDGNLWTASSSDGLLPTSTTVYRITPAGVATPFTMAVYGRAGWITASNTRIWVAYLEGNMVMEIDPDTGTGTAHAAWGGMTGIAAGAPVGGLDQVAFTQGWYVPFYIGRLAPGGAVQETDVPGASYPRAITFGTDGAYWITHSANSLSRS